MSTTTLIIIGIIVLVALGGAAMILSRSWGGSFGAGSQPPRVRVQNIAGIPEHEQAAIRVLLDNGNKIGAIKRVRELTGMGLKEAKDYVDGWQRGGALAALDVAANPPIEGSLAGVHALALQGNKIGAIKLYRELTGAGLKDAKDYVDALESGAVPQPAAPQVDSTASLDEVHLLALQGNKIGAIKLYRELTGAGLKDAKDYVDRIGPS